MAPIPQMPHQKTLQEIPLLCPAMLTLPTSNLEASRETSPSSPSPEQLSAANFPASVPCISPPQLRSLPVSLPYRQLQKPSEHWPAPRTKFRCGLQKALKILSNLDAEDDVEWAAAAGRDGLGETDKAVGKFETLVEIYVQAIDELQMRSDVGDVEAKDLQAVVDQMESTLADWDEVRRSLKGVHSQVELAMEWEELWGTVLGDVGEEMDSLSRLVFEMEEKRHMSMREDAHPDGGKALT